MMQLDDALSTLIAHEGVEHVLLLGRDGLLVRHLGAEGELDADTVAAMIPSVASACGALARAAGRGAFSTAVVELGRGVALVASLSTELLLAVFVRPNVGFAPLLRQLRATRGELAGLL